MADSYVCSGAMMRCTMGTNPARLTVLPIRTVFLAGQPQANVSDHISMVNLGAFGLCRSLGYPPTASATAAAMGTLTPMPCMHNTPIPWMGGKMDTLIKGQPALLKSCKCQCLWGGTITLITNGQVGQGAQGVFQFPRMQNYPLVLVTKQEALKFRKGQEKYGKEKWSEMLSWAKQNTGTPITQNEIMKERKCSVDEAMDLLLQVEKARLYVAYQEYRERWPDTPVKIIKSHLNYIDLSNPVNSKMIPPPEKLLQYVITHIDGSYELGDYYGTPGSTSDSLGVSGTFTRRIHKSNDGRKREIFINQREGIIKIYEKNRPPVQCKMTPKGLVGMKDKSNADILDYLSSHSEEENYGVSKITSLEICPRAQKEIPVNPPPVPCLMSTAKHGDDNWSIRRVNTQGKEEAVKVPTRGFGTQYFSPELSKRLKR